jgi:hypothetical protein
MTKEYDAEMFAVYRTYSDGYTYSDTVLFVTECEQTAKDAVTLAELELEQALAVPQPSWTGADIVEKGYEYALGLREAYSKELASIFTVDPMGSTYSVDVNTTYYYDKVQVR